jgi:hypothetical protein
MPGEFTRKAGRFRTAGSVGETPTDAVETTALLKKSLMIRELTWQTIWHGERGHTIDFCIKKMFQNALNYLDLA